MFIMCNKMMYIGDMVVLIFCISNELSNKYAYFMVLILKVTVGACEMFDKPLNFAWLPS